MKTTVKKMDYEAVMALPRPEHKLPVKTNLFFTVTFKVRDDAPIGSTEVKLDGEEFIILRQNDVLAKIED